MPRIGQTEEEGKVETGGELKKEHLGGARGGFKYIPFVDKDSLPKDVRIDTKGKVHRPGTPHYYMLRVGNTIKVIAIRRNGKGISRGIDCVLKLGKMNKRGARDKAVYTKLKKAGLPEL